MVLYVVKRDPKPQRKKRRSSPRKTKKKTPPTPPASTSTRSSKKKRPRKAATPRSPRSSSTRIIVDENGSGHGSAPPSEVVKGLGRVTTPEARTPRGRGWRSARLDQERAEFEAREKGVKEAKRATVRHACVDRVQAARKKGREEVLAARTQRTARTERAKTRCEKVKVGTTAVEARELARLRELRAENMRALRKELYAKKPRTRAQELGDQARAAKRRKRKGPRMAERIDLEAENVPKHWRRLFRKNGAHWIRLAEEQSARRGRGPKTWAYELFGEWLQAQGVHDIDNPSEVGRADVGELEHQERETERAIKARQEELEREQAEYEREHGTAAAGAGDVDELAGALPSFEADL